MSWKYNNSTKNSYSNIQCVLTSCSEIKKEALTNFLGPEINFTCIDTSACGNPEQPVGNLAGMLCCKERIKWTLKTTKFEPNIATVIFSIENAIEKRNGKTFDVVHIVRYNFSTSSYYYYYGGECEFPSEYWNEALNTSGNTITSLGWSVTIGDIFHKHFETCNPKDWISFFTPKFSRKQQLITQLSIMTSKYSITKNDLLVNVNYIQDFPKSGILFKDFSSLLSDYRYLTVLIQECKTLMDKNTHRVKYNGDDSIDYIIGLESRGFILGSVLAHEIGCGFAMVRKHGKLPPPVVSADYIKEYGTDTFDMQLEIFPSHKSLNVWIVDDLLATGGSIACAIELIEKINLTRNGFCKIHINGCLVVLQVDELAEIAAEKLKNTPVHVLLK